VAGGTKTRFGFAVFAHTNPVYVDHDRPSSLRAGAARGWARQITTSMDFMRKSYRFANEADQAIALGRFEQGLQYYAKLSA
jgi:hypothetical protein